MLPVFELHGATSVFVNREVARTFVHAGTTTLEPCSALDRASLPVGSGPVVPAPAPPAPVAP